LIEVILSEDAIYNSASVIVESVGKTLFLIGVLIYIQGPTGFNIFTQVLWSSIVPIGEEGRIAILISLYASLTLAFDCIVLDQAKLSHRDFRRVLWIKQGRYGV
jgi:hypothetical protein